VRATVPGVLDRFELPNVGEPPEEAPRQWSVFSIVVDDPAKKTRRLPAYYHGGAEIFRGRDVDEVGRRLAVAARRVLDRHERGSYLANPVRFGERRGLWVRDICNRSALRTKFERSGFEFADEQYVTLDGEGRVEAAGWGAFAPDFLVVSRIAAGTPKETPRGGGGSAAFLLAMLRIGPVPPHEFGTLVGLVRGAAVIGSGDPDVVRERIDSL
jgi:hypothetical protein